MNIRELEKFLAEKNQPEFRLKQIKKAVYRDGASSFLEISTIPKDLREVLHKNIEILSFTAEKILVSRDKRSIKALLKLRDGNFIETVLISPKPGIWSACVSSQVGCPLACRFCATGKLGFKRNLTAEEITDQILFWRQYLKKENIPGSFSHVVYMGMGEPLLNWEETRKSLENLTDKNFFGFGSRGISVSTSGIPEGIANMAQYFPQINLALSLHFADDEKRSQFMPISKKYGLKEIRNALQEYFKKTKRKVFIEYIVMEGINDGIEDAGNLVFYLKSVGNMHLFHVNLIRYNIVGQDYRPSSREKTQQFKNFLLDKHINATIRKSLGEEIQGACGQLAGK